MPTRLTELEPITDEDGNKVRRYLETPLLMEPGDYLGVMFDGNLVYQSRDGKIIAETRWTSERPHYLRHEN